MSKKNVTSPSAVLQSLRDLLKGLKTLPTNKNYEVGGVSMSVASMQKRVEEYIEQYERPEELHDEWKASLKVRDDADEPRRQYVMDLEAMVRGHFGPTNVAVTKFGLEPRKLHPNRRKAAEEQGPETPPSKAP